jgi:hypothetical protein
MNPPYKHALDFIKKALTEIEKGNKVCVFLKIQFLESQTRKEFFKEHPPKRIYVYSKRISCLKSGKPQGASTLCYCWYIWEKGFKGDPIIKWI